jgi:hypothetical protein
MRNLSKFDQMRERSDRRPKILDGIMKDLKHSEIADRIGVNRWVVMNDLRMMRHNGDLELKRAEEVQQQIKMRNQSRSAKARNDRFLRMTGMTLQERSFRNMIEFYRPELIGILKSKDQNNAIFKLPKSTRRPLTRNGIITKGWHNREITPDARKYLTGI